MAFPPDPTRPQPPVRNRTADEELFAEMDRLAAELNERRRMRSRDGVTTRFVGEHHWDTVVAGDPKGD